QAGRPTSDSQMAVSGSILRPGYVRLAFCAIDSGVCGSVDNDIGPLLPQRVSNRFLPGDVDRGAIDARNPVIRRPHSSAQLMSDLTGGAEHKKFHRESSRSIIEMARQFREHRLPAILVRQQRFFL